MPLFNKKPTTAEEISKAIANLSDEDKKKVFEQSFKDRLDESVVEQEHLDDSKDSQSAKDRVDEHDGEEMAIEEHDAAETEAVDGADDVADDNLGGEGNEEDGIHDDVVVSDDQEEHHEDVMEAMTARVEALEKRVEEFAEIIKDIADLGNADTPLGASGQADVGEADDALTEDDRIMRKYNPNWRRG